MSLKLISSSLPVLSSHYISSSVHYFWESTLHCCNTLQSWHHNCTQFQHYLHNLNSKTVNMNLVLRVQNSTATEFLCLKCGNNLKSVNLKLRKIMCYLHGILARTRKNEQCRKISNWEALNWDSTVYKKVIVHDRLHNKFNSNCWWGWNMVSNWWMEIIFKYTTKFLRKYVNRPKIQKSLKLHVFIYQENLAISLDSILPAPKYCSWNDIILSQILTG